MAHRIFLPCSPTLMNAGKPRPMLSACFVLPIEDSIEEIFESVKHTALIQRAGGGTGFSFDHLRPTGDRVASSGGTTSGPISFWRVFSEATNAIQQGALRRGANMGLMSIDHPDILKFILAKQNHTAFTNFNISIKVNEKWMRTLKKPHKVHIVRNPRTGIRYLLPRKLDIATYSIDQLEPYTPKAACDSKKFYTVGDIWTMIVTNAHSSGDPGLLFIDRVNEDNPTPALGPIEATNPCGEQPLMPYECCTLGSINLSQIVLEDGSDLDWDCFAEVIAIAMRFLDNTLDANWYPLAVIEQTSKANRKIGLGIMGFADALIRLGIRYDSDDAQRLASRISSFLTETAHTVSETLAKERGCFPNWAKSVWRGQNRKMRNACLTTFAPTGTIAILCLCSSGIEPIFAFIIKRRALEGKEFTFLHPLLQELGTKQGWLTDEVRNLLVQGIHPKDIPQIP
ncbi:MAG: adenosylcobalamin-dependent ribonucleoside-diphosphate reductase, partial [Sedimentisphaerales bacterium]|nr:adenosylcobalamin-dependent ribonucleoside-diphosphate reductase [Sedimentisphaerales bacterium]